jgi:hypothetical protein
MRRETHYVSSIYYGDVSKHKATRIPVPTSVTHKKSVASGWGPEGWRVLDHPPHSPNLAQSDLHLFARLKAHVVGKRFATSDNVLYAVVSWVKTLTPISSTPEYNLKYLWWLCGSDVYQNLCLCQTSICVRLKHFIQAVSTPSYFLVCWIFIYLQSFIIQFLRSTSSFQTAYMFSAPRIFTWSKRTSFVNVVGILQ